MGKLSIENILDRIAEGYQSGTLAWMKVRRPEDWKRMIKLEEEINRTILEENEVKLVNVLSEYESFFLKMGRTFKTPEGETRSLF